MDSNTHLLSLLCGSGSERVAFHFDLTIWTLLLNTRWPHYQDSRKDEMVMFGLDHMLHILNMRKKECNLLQNDPMASLSERSQSWLTCGSGWSTGPACRTVGNQLCSTHNPQIPEISPFPRQASETTPWKPAQVCGNMDYLTLVTWKKRRLTLKVQVQLVSGG